MNIGYDAKRAFHNGTGLGHYSRTLLNSLALQYPEHDYFLFNPKASSFYRPPYENMHIVLPKGFWSKKFSGAWRSRWVKNDFRHYGIQLYHGLSHEIPFGVRSTGVPTVVTMHDLIHERYPEQYPKIDVKIYQKKFSFACTHSHHIIAISEQTKKDVMEFYGISANKITVCYQSCNPMFAQKISTDEKKRIKHLYGLPDRFFLYVGSIIERKNLHTICEALYQQKGTINLPLVVIGEGSAYKEKVKTYIREKGLEEQVIFLSESSAAKQNQDFKNARDFPAIYQMALAMIYPSVFEGFGIPVLEALWSRIPVITSNVSCLPEAAGKGSLLIDPMDATAMASAMELVARDQDKRMQMIDDGWHHAHQFTNEKCAAAVMEVYQKLVPC